MKLKSLLPNVFMAACLIHTATAHAATLEVAGSTTVQKSIIEPASAKVLEATGLELKMMGVGTGKGMLMLFDGKVTVAAVSDDLADAVAGAKKAGATNVPANLKMVTILQDDLVPIVHASNKVGKLSKEQVRDILTGKIANWKDVGGAEGAILVVIPAAGSGTRAVIEKQVIGGAAFAAGAKELRTSSAEVAEVARAANAIGYVGAGVAEGSKGKVSTVEGAKVSRPLGFVTIGDPSPEAKKLFEFLQTSAAKKLYLQ